MPKVLIANRGEIAVRVHRAATAVGLESVAVFTPDDHNALHVRLADQARMLTGELGYLDAEQLINVALQTGCILVHPGYGFLSEDALFADLCAKAGLTFVGPSSEVLTLFGDKSRSREYAQQNGVPVLPASNGDTSLAEAAQFLTDLGRGAGVMIKALAGGGGRGMRPVRDAKDLTFAYERCRSEAHGAFGNPAVYVEQLLRRARHVEVQILGDGSGQVSHLWDRDCTVQRRNQKLIEIAPCLSIPSAVREELRIAACRMAEGVAFRGLGTFEFLVDADSPEQFYFIEVNPRIQVEHTVTEEITGIDLAASQFEIALGRSLRDLQLDQASVPEPRGIAIECRVNLEEVASDGIARATIGTLESFETPSGPGIRVDTGGFRSYLSTGKYDSLLAKVITSTSRGGLQRTAAMADAALAEFRVSGPGTNIGLLRAILQDPDFLHSVVTTTFVDDSAAELMPVAHAAPPANGDREVVALYGGTIVALPVAVGEHVAVGAPIVVLESMKMEHVVSAARSGTVDELLVNVGESIASGAVLVRITPDHIQEQVAGTDVVVDLNEIRPDLAEVVERQRLVLDAARPEAVARRRRTDQRTARENISDLCDEGEFSEYGGLVLAAQRQRRSVEDLITNTPADGIVAGVGHVNGHLAGPVASRCVVLAYDYTVLAGTQGVLSHRKTDRMLEIAAKQQLPVVLFSEGGGGRPGDTDTTMASGLDVTTFSAMGRLSGLVPTIGIVSGRCFAGNAALLGCCDLIIATRDATIGMGGPAMIEGGGLGKFLPADVGPTSIHVPNGVIDVLTDNEAQAVAVAKRYLSYFQGPARDWECADQRRLRHVVPPNRVQVYDIREAISLIADTDTVLELRSQFGVGIVTALIRIQGRPMGLVANDPAHLGGAIDTAAADKMARFLQLCDAHGLAVLSLCDTPGFMVGPDSERNASVRHFSRLFVIGANLTVPMVSVVLRKGYGLGAQAMAGGGFREPAMTLAWPTGEIGAMGIEGSVRLGYRRELNAVGDPEKRGVEFDRLVAEQYSKGKALNAAAVFELDDVIDPADTRRRIAGALPPASIRGTSRRRQYIDSW